MVSTTILEAGEAERTFERTSCAVLRSVSIWVITTSGLFSSTRAMASSPPVEERPTTSMPSPWEARMDSKPSLNMVWSSARCTRTVIVGSFPHEQGPCRKTHTEIAHIKCVAFVTTSHLTTPGARAQARAKTQYRASPSGCVAVPQAYREEVPRTHLLGTSVNRAASRKFDSPSLGGACLFRRVPRIGDGAWLLH